MNVLTSLPPAAVKMSLTSLIFTTARPPTLIARMNATYRMIVAIHCGTPFAALFMGGNVRQRRGGAAGNPRADEKGPLNRGQKGPGLLLDELRLHDGEESKDESRNHADNRSSQHHQQSWMAGERHG